MRKAVTQLSGLYELDALEVGFVQTFLQQNNLQVQRNKLLLAQTQQELPAGLLDDIDRLCPPLTFERLVTGFELLIPAADRKLNGAFFTPARVSAFLAQETITATTVTAVDPSCGCGALLLASADRFAALHDEPLTQIIKNRVFGVDLCDYNLRRAQLLLTLRVLVSGEDPVDLPVNLQAANSLDVDWKELFPGQNGVFDAVIGNPPYVRFQHLDERVRVDLQRWQTIGPGNYNLYVPFYELAWGLLRENGRMGFITPNSFFALAAAAPLRAWLAQTRFLDTIVDFGHHRVFDASVYTCLAFGRRTSSPPAQLRYVRLPDTSALAQADALVYDQLPYESFSDKRWDLLSHASAQIIAEIEQESHLPLGKLVDVRGGIATLRDRLYLARLTPEGWVTADGHPLENDIVAAVVRVSDFADDRALAANDRGVLYPYERDGTQVNVLDEKLLRKKYPQAYAYLLSVRDELAQRDKGKKEYPAWYAYGRSQGLVPLGDCLFTPVYAEKPRFLRGGSNNELFLNGLALTLRADAGEQLGMSQDETLTYLQACLHGSPVLRFYMNQLSQNIAGGYAHYRPALLKRFRVPRMTDSERQQLLNASATDRSRMLAAAYGVDAAHLVVTN